MPVAARHPPPQARTDRPVAIVVPCYNEAERLRPEAFVAFARGQETARLLFVDDGSSDATVDVLRDLARRAPEAIDWMSLDRNSGKAEAVRQGLLRAGHHAGTRYVGYWDADLSTPLELVPDFIRVLDEHAGVRAVIGTRIGLCGRVIERDWYRRALSGLFAGTASLVLGARIRDTQCGAKLLDATLVDRLLAEPFHSRWIFDVELLQRLRAVTGRPLGEVIYELPLQVWREVGGSRLKSTDFLRAIHELLAIARTGPSVPPQPPTADSEKPPEDVIRRAA